MRKIAWAIPIVFTLSFVHLSYGQFEKAFGPKSFTDFKPLVGGWSEYQKISKSGESLKRKFAIVGKEGDAYWYESVMEGGRKGRFVVKLLVSGDPREPKNVKRVIQKAGINPAVEFPVEVMQRLHTDQEQKGKIIDKGNETIKVPAGSFSTRHMQYRDGEEVLDTWVCKDVSPYGIIKSQWKDNEMVLIGYGTGAKTLITETPQKVDPSQMRQRK